MAKLAIKHYDLTGMELRKRILSPDFTKTSNLSHPVTTVCKVSGSKLHYLNIMPYNKAGELYVLATPLKKKLETRFMVGGPAQNDYFHIDEEIGRPFRTTAPAFVPLRKQLIATIKDIEFKVNKANHYISTQDLATFIAVYKLTRIPEQSDKQIDAYLKEVYEENNTLYHQGTGESNLTDQQFDKLRIYLIAKRLIDPAKTGAAPAPTSKKVELKTPLGSLENAFTPDELVKWFNKYPATERAITTPKIDGISGQVDYVKGILQGGNTKGDGFIGEDITGLLKIVPRVPKKLKKPITISIRTELFIENSVFEKKYGENSGRAKPFATPRNMMAGLKNRKTPDPEVAKDVAVLGYSIIGREHEDKITQLKEIHALGFPVVPFHEIALKDLKKAGAIFQDFKTTQDYAMDGAVIELVNPKLRSDYVAGKINPRFAVAFKPETQTAETEITGIDWAISKDKYAKPVARVNSVKVGGVNVTSITLHNAKKVKDLKLGKGATVLIQRSGDAIPHILKTIKPATKIGLPKAGEWGGWHWNSTGVDILVNEDVHSDEHEIEKIVSFFTALKVERFSEGLIKSFYEHGFKTIPDILHMTKDQIIKEVPRQGDTSAQNIITEFAKLKSPGVLLADLMYASGCFGRGLGKNKMADLYAEYGDTLITGWAGTRLDDIAASIDEIPGFSYETGKQFALGIKPYLTFYRSVKDVISIKTASAKKEGKLTGQRIAFTQFRNKDWVTRIAELGGDYSDSISAKTTILVNGGGASEKTKKAEKNGTKIMSRTEFEKLLK